MFKRILVATLSTMFLASASVNAQSLDEATSLLKQGKIKQSETILKKLIESDPGNGDVHLRMGMCLACQNKLDEALVYLENAERLKSSDYWVNVKMGQVYANKSNWQKAAENFKKACSKNPKSYQANYNLGLALNCLNQTAESEAAFRKAAELKPENPNPLLGIAIMYRRLGEKKKAKKLLEEALTKIKDKKSAKTFKEEFKNLPKDVRIVRF